MIERCRMFSLRGEKGSIWPDEYLKGCHFQEGLALFCVVPVSGVRVSAKELQREDSEKSGASKLRMGDLRRSLTRVVQAPLFVLLWKISKHHMSGWARGPFPTKGLWNEERSWTERESRDEHVPGVYYCFKWNHSCLGNSTKSLIFTGG